MSTEHKSRHSHHKRLRSRFTPEKWHYQAKLTERRDSSDDDKDYCSKGVKYFLRNTTLHGLKYMAEEKITLPERIFFGLAFACVIIISAFFISNVYSKWSATPIIITTSAKQTLTSDMPFPAITICNLNQALKSRVHHIPRPSANFSLLMSLCNEHTENTISYAGTWSFFKAILIEVAQPCNKMMLYCSYGAHTEDCSLIFHPVLTDDGLCCTFNALDPSFLLKNFTEESRLMPSVSSRYKPIDWTPEQGYRTEELPQYFYPRIPGGTGSRMGLTVILNSSSAEYYCSKSKSIGFKVLVHSPAELPKISNYGLLVTTGREARVQIEPDYENAVPSIRQIKKDLRRCLFSDEGDLVYYRTYSRKNCELECEAAILMSKCHCILYYLPRIDPSVRICGPNDNTCTNMVQSVIESSNKSVSCAGCLPACFELNYKASLSASKIVGDNFRSADNYPDHIFNDSARVSDISIMHFYYISNIFRSTTKSEMFGFTEFLSNTGGLLGLFMGFSIFSLIEIVYYVSVRPYCANRTLEQVRQRKRAKVQAWPEGTAGSSLRPTKNDSASLKVLHRKKLFAHSYKNALPRILLQQQQQLGNDEQTRLFPYID